ncbi:MAG: hypothetical protein ACN6PF_23990 [Achromobacter veterisilvae]
MKNASLALAAWLAVTICGSSFANPIPESIGTSPELSANIYFPEEKGPKRTTLTAAGDLTTIVLFRTQSSRALYLAIVGYKYCSGEPSSVVLTNPSQKKSTRSVEIRKSDKSKTFNHLIANAMCKDYVASNAASTSTTKSVPTARPVTFKPFNDEAIFEATLTGGAGTAQTSYRGSARVDGSDVIADVIGTNHRSGQKTIVTFKVPKTMCETGTGQALVTDGRRGWTDAITLNNRKPARYYATNDLTLGIVDGICQRSGNISLLKGSTSAESPSNNTDTRHDSAQAGKSLTMGELTQCTHEWVKAFNDERGEEGPIAVAQLDEWEQWCKQGKRPG